MRSTVFVPLLSLLLCCVFVTRCLGATCPTNFTEVNNVCTKNFNMNAALPNNGGDGYSFGYNIQSGFVKFATGFTDVTGRKRWGNSVNNAAVPLMAGFLGYGAQDYPTNKWITHPATSNRATVKFLPTETTCKVYQVSHAVWRGDSGTNIVAIFTHNGATVASVSVTPATSTDPPATLSTFCLPMEPNALFDLSIDCNGSENYDTTSFFMTINATCATSCAQLACLQTGKCAVGAFSCDNNGSCTVPKCNYGFLDSSSTAACLCYSGYYGPACISSPPPQCTPITPNRTQTSDHPVFNQEKTRYVNNTLIVVLNGTYTKGRTYKAVYIEGATSSKCNMTNGGYWSQDFVECKDEFTFRMPWANRATCGFNTTTTEAATIYRSVIWVEYVDSLGNFSKANLALSRSVKQQYDVIVSLPRSLTVSMPAVNVSSTVAMDVALSNEKYDSVTNRLTIELTSIVAYPHKLQSDGATMTSLPEDISADGAITVDSSLCTQSVASVCVQKLKFKLALAHAEICSFSGQYTLSATLSNCRENNNSACATANVVIGFTLASGSVCASVKVADMVMGTIKAYPTNVFSGTPSGNYKYGNPVYFYVSASSASNTPVTIKFLDITMDANAGSGSIYLLKNGTVQSNGTLSTLTVFDNANYFWLYVTSQVFNNPAGSYVLTAKCQVSYFEAGKKRTIVEEQVSHISASTRIHVAQQQQQQQHHTKPLSSHVAPHKQTSIAAGKSTASATVGFTHIVAIAGAVSSVFLVVLVASLYYKFKTQQTR